MPNQTKIISCARSGVPLMEVTTLCSNSWALLQYPHLHNFVHPIYGMPLDKLLRKLTAQLLDAESSQWTLFDSAVRELGLSMSAIMYSLDAMWIPNSDAIESGRLIEPSLPDPKVTVGCAARLLDLATWYNTETSKRIEFPLWKPSVSAGNLNWHGFSNWLNACFEIREDWTTQKRKYEDKELLTSTTQALQQVRMASMYKKIDFGKVWTWIDVQARSNPQYPAGRRETLKTLFMSGDQEPSEWLADDVDDLVMMILDCCDPGNDIMAFIKHRVNSIRSQINDFYNNFTLFYNPNKSSNDSLDLSVAEQQAQDKLVDEFSSKLTAEAPKEPRLEDYPSRVHWLRASAEYRILSKLYANRKEA